ncbi:CCHC-type domain-containing protein [Abeliophyllum distichum]|uniref:CCHC-type domain-containing protein n=1 Tax=Abeliophyllum distichum TaxID=126358 RepID=A0ABD1SW95_9LAMI
MDHELSIDLVLQSLPDSFSQFIMNFNMNKIQCTMSKLLNMLKTVEPNIIKGNGQILAIDTSKGTKRKSKRTFQKGSKKAKSAEKIVKADNAKSKSVFPLWKQRTLEEELQDIPRHLEGK